MRYLLVLAAGVALGVSIYSWFGAEARAGGKWDMKCDVLENTSPSFDRCENQEAVCYKMGTGLSCKFK